MEKLQISYVTWARSDANGLFDYEDLKNQKPDNHLMITQSGFICRNKLNHKLQFTICKNPHQSIQKILKLIKKDNHYLLCALNINNEPLFKIIEKQKPETHQIQKDDTLRLGKVVIQVLQLQFKTKKRISSYALLKQQILKTKPSLIRQITPKFYGQDQTKISKFNQSQQTSLQSFYEENPTCRYCYSKTVTQSNPFIVSCGCIGSTKYIHERCLLEWVLRRGQLRQRSNNGVVFAQQKVFKCQLCHEFFYIPDMWKKVFDFQQATYKNLQGSTFEEVLILHVKNQINWLYFIDLSHSRQIYIGRSLDNDIILNELSVSRQHAKKIITLKNNNAKFGTLVQIKKSIEIKDHESYQVGRTKMEFIKHEKKSFFDRIGLFCFVQQKLQNQSVKSKRIPKLQMKDKKKEQKQVKK